MACEAGCSPKPIVSSGRLFPLCPSRRLPPIPGTFSGKKQPVTGQPKGKPAPEGRASELGQTHAAKPRTCRGKGKGEEKETREGGVLKVAKGKTPPWAGLLAAGVTPQMSDIAVQSTRSHREEHARSLPTPASRALEVTAHLQCGHLLSIVPLSYGRAKRPCSEKKGDREHKTICISEAVGDQNFHSRPPRSGCNAMPMETSLCAAELKAG